MKRKLIGPLAYHRNGIAGMGFYVGLVRDDDGSRKVVIRVPNDENDTDRKAGAELTFVLDVDMLAAGNITFGENSWRGDDYTAFMNDAITGHNFSQSPV